MGLLAGGVRGEAPGWRHTGSAHRVTRLGEANLDWRAESDTVRPVPGSRRPHPRSAALRLPAVRVDALVEQDQHVLLWQVRGRSDVVVRDEPIALQAGQALWVPVRTPHSFVTREDSVVLPMFFAAARSTPRLPVGAVLTVDADLRTLFLAFVQSTYTIIRPPVDLARQILTTIERTPGLISALTLPTSRAARAVALALRADPGDERGVDELARSVHTSARTLERAFRAETGTTLRRWRIVNRMEAAGALLRARTDPDVVGARVGYRSTSAFRRVFKEHHGTTPVQYAARMGEEL